MKSFFDEAAKKAGVSTIGKHLGRVEGLEGLLASLFTRIPSPRVDLGTGISHTFEFSGPTKKQTSYKLKFLKKCKRVLRYIETLD